MKTTHAVLTALDRVHPYLMPEQSLLIDVNAMLARPIGLTELRQALSHLESRRMVISVAADDTSKWRLTETGQGELAALGK